MRNKYFIKYTLLLIVILAGILRFYNLGQNPPSLSWDETAQGYNAYTLGKTGTDEFGRIWPLDYLESFGDFKPVLYTYLTILPVKIFGLNEFSTRFAGAFFGTLTVLLCFYLVVEVFYVYKEKEFLGLSTVFLLAVSPWHLLLSRGAYEANIGLFLVVLGSLFLLKGLRGNRYSFLGSVIPFALTFYTFNSTRAFIPFFLMAIFILYRQYIYSHLKLFLLYILFFIFLLLPVIPHLLSPQANLRFREVNIFSDLKPIEKSNYWIETDKNSRLAKIIHNRRLLFSLEYLAHYFDHFDLKFLFIQGDVNPRFSTQDTGQIFLINLPFFLIGCLVMFKKYRQEGLFLTLWLLTGIIPAATARETPHALRILQTLPIWHIIIAIGLYESWLWIKINFPRHSGDLPDGKAGSQNLYNKLFNRFRIKSGMTLIYSFYLLLFTFNFIFYLHNYFFHYPREYAEDFQYGYKEAMNYILVNYDKYDRFLVTESLGRPYIYALFYGHYQPEEFQKTAKIERDAFGFVKVKGFAKYLFGSPVIAKDYKDKKILIVALPGEVPSGKIIKSTIHYPSGDTALVLYEN